MPPKQSKNWVFTINNPASDDEPRAWSEECKFICWQREVGDNGTPHLQGTLVLFNNKTMGGMKKVHATAHWEVRQGTIGQAVHYCKKPVAGCDCDHCKNAKPRLSGPFVIGDEPADGPGGRSDLKKMQSMLDAGMSELDIAQQEFALWARNFKACERYKRLKTTKQRNWATQTVIYWGPPGIGKTKRALEEAGPDAYWMKKPGNNQNVNFDGYDGQEVVVIDEFYGWLPMDLLCRMCDRYPLMVDTKGGMVNFYPRKIIITSNKDPYEWYKNGLGALERRFTPPLGQIVFMDEDFVASTTMTEHAIRAETERRPGETPLTDVTSQPMEVTQAGATSMLVSSTGIAIDVDKMPHSISCQCEECECERAERREVPRLAYLKRVRAQDLVYD